MDAETKRKRLKLNSIITFGLLVLIMLFFLYCIFIRKGMGPEYPFVVVGALFLIWINSDIISIVMTDGFADKTTQQTNAYKMYSFLDLVGLAGISCFILMQSSGMTGAIIYVGATVLKRKYLDLFKYGPEPEEEDEDEVIDAEASIEDAEPEDAELLEMQEESDTASDSMERKTTAQLIEEAEQERE